MGGLRHLTGFPGGPPVRSNISLGDSLAGLHAAFGTVLALLARHRIQGRGEGQAGQVVDVAIYESVFNMLEGVIPDYDRFGMVGASVPHHDGRGINNREDQRPQVRQPSGTTVTGIVPTNAYPCQGGRWVVIGGNGDSIYVRLMKAAGRPDLVGCAAALPVQSASLTPQE
jgi:crotonobetainyl-CoA:carnitine CoA-transferase CaiB-like acyl-CoA transferase